MDNTEIFDFLLDAGHIPICRGKLFNQPSFDTPRIDFESIEGMMLGLAIGDALGAPSEGMLPEKRRVKYGDIREYQPNRDDGRRVGIPTDDSQLAFWTLEQLLHDDGFDPNNVANRFCQDRLYGMGGSIREFIRNYSDKGESWLVAGSESAGNGALMRIAPMTIPHINDPEGLWADTALSAMITHRDSASIAACVSFTQMLWKLLARDTVPEPEWWVNEYVETARQLETDHSHTPRSDSITIDYRGPIWRFVDEYVPLAYRQGLSTLEGSNYWYSGAYLLETVPTSLYILMQHRSDPEEAIVRAVTDTKDNDTIGAIVGAAVGALHGIDALPERWLTGLTGRTKSNDNGRMFELLNQAEREWHQHE